MLKYKREGLAYEIWRNGTMTRAAQGKSFPTKCEEAIPELFEKQEGVKIQDLPPELQSTAVNTLPFPRRAVPCNKGREAAAYSGGFVNSLS